MVEPPSMPNNSDYVEPNPLDTMSETLPDTDEVIKIMERGTLACIFDLEKRPEDKQLMIRRETRQIIWKRNVNLRSYDGSVEFRDIKEIRSGRCSKDFERWHSETKKMKAVRAFVIYYGSKFLLKTISVYVPTERDRLIWEFGLQCLMSDTKKASSAALFHSWLQKEFYEMQSAQGTMELKNLKVFLSRHNCNLSTPKLKEFLENFNPENKDEIEFGAAVKLYHKLLSEHEKFTGYDRLLSYSENGETMTVQEFHKFLNEEQKDPVTDEAEVARFITEYIHELRKDDETPYLMMTEFFEFLFSKENEIWDTKNDQITQDMTQPLCNYWIASSHNTYLTRDQLLGESSCESYARALRSGCRCIELDCWNGSDGMPVIYHGHTATPKIKFIDVINTIKDHAFVTSDYPVILSIEEHCDLYYQRKMASIMRKVFGKMLLTKRITRVEPELPSPEMLRGRIILKHGTLPDHVEQKPVVKQPIPDEVEQEMDLRNTIKSGILYLENSVEKTWIPQFFVLTERKLYYTDIILKNSETNVEEEETGSTPRASGDVPNEELHYGEEWFHGTLSKGRQEAEELLNRFSHLGDGTFLVRQSGVFVGDYCLSFWHGAKPNHCRIKSRQEGGRTKFYFVDTMCFDDLYSLIVYYRTHPLRTQQRLTILLTQPVPQPSKHEEKNWWHPECTREEAVKLLKEVFLDGVFLVRQSEMEPHTYVVSFRADRKIKHCRIGVEGRLYTIGVFQFESLVELISYYERHPLYNKTKLSHSVTQCQTMMNQNGVNAEFAALCSAGYMDHSYFAATVTVKAIYDYIANRDDELTFSKHAIITNVNRGDGNGGWWRGDHGGKKQLLFPSNFVEDFEPDVNHDESPEMIIVANLQKGSLDIMGAEATFIPRDRPGVSGIIRVRNSKVPDVVFDLAALSDDSAKDWMRCLKEAVKHASAKQKKRNAMEQKKKIAKEMSDLTIYCCTVSFDKESIVQNGFVCHQMSSFQETRAQKLICTLENKFFLKYHQFQLSRVYPAGLRFASSNYNPVPLWNSGSQMVALNYQTGDKYMQLNQGKFRENGKCGYLLKPEFMKKDHFDPYDKNTLIDVDTLKLKLIIIGARHLRQLPKGLGYPSVDIEIIGTDFDTGAHNKYTTQTVENNGFNPIWDECCEFEVDNPDFAMLRFVVHDESVFGEGIFNGQATYPVRCLRSGFRSVPLQNKFSEEMKFASLLVHLTIEVVKKPEITRTDSSKSGLHESALEVNDITENGNVSESDPDSSIFYYSVGSSSSQSELDMTGHSQILIP
ncbi:1-phosphatidylinositol 4,5-bisphosphate phosphodiesterase gamma-1-like [Neodiprion pinetum]|uniref:1-phosphatidylinositol 4,5-bisphosphate phosphodiesterase gamma-1-like n=1 Tax=Neodiprion pinetum TaxID=441929 RepID=UPI001EE0CD77|nr:1-phosphatidylinositol 4,5-bisphosphate phosphodiesterase gamma-1-like [Neodiprion pinetum]